MLLLLHEMLSVIVLLKSFKRLLRVLYVHNRGRGRCTNNATFNVNNTFVQRSVTIIISTALYALHTP